MHHWSVCMRCNRNDCFVTVLYYSSRWFRGGTRNRRLGDDWNGVEHPKRSWSLAANTPNMEYFCIPAGPSHTSMCEKSASLAHYTYKCCWALCPCVSCTFTYHTWQFIIFTIFTITACIFSYSLSISFWTQDLALQQILSSTDLFLSYRTDSMDSRTI